MYQPLITFCPHPAIFTQVLRIFVYNLERKPFVATKIRYFSKTSKFSSVKAFDLVVLFIVFPASIIVYRVSSYIRDNAMV